MTKKTKIITVIIVPIIFGILVWWTWKNILPYLTESEIEVIGTVDASNGFRLQANCLKGTEGSNKEAERCSYRFGYYQNSSYYAGDITNRKVRLKAILKRPRDCLFNFKKDIPECQFYLEPIEIKIWEKQPEGVIVSTDREEYSPQTQITITIQNTTGHNIQYWDRYGSSYFPFAIARLLNGVGEELYIPTGCTCRRQCQEDPPQIVELKKDESTFHNWGQEEYCSRDYVGAGTYMVRFTYYDPYDPQDNTKNTFTVYSNGFIIR